MFFVKIKMDEIEKELHFVRKLKSEIIGKLDKIIEKERKLEQKIISNCLHENVEIVRDFQHTIKLCKKCNSEVY